MSSDNFQIIEIDESSWRIESSFVRAFLFAGEKKALLVDTTAGPGDLKSVVEKLAGDKPVVLVNTHADSDHIGCNEQFEETYMHPAEFAYYAIKRKDGDAAEKPLLDGEVIDLGGRSFEVILAPGHTSGSILLLNRKERFLIGGDSILENVFIFGQVRNLNAMIASLENICDRYWDAFDRVYVSHGRCDMDKSFIRKELACAKAHREGKITGKDVAGIPLEPPDFKPAQSFELDGAVFFDYK